MFFGMINLSAMFQDMMNEILRDMINKEKVVVFMDDVLVETETEKGHNKCNKMADELEHSRWRIILFLFHFPLLCNSLKCTGHYDSKGVRGII